jgi:two-component system, OmpR family, KDP operon response regulator KdpE
LMSGASVALIAAGRAGIEIMARAAPRLLIIGDDPVIRRQLRAHLAREEFLLMEAATASRAEILARRHAPDLLLLDLGPSDTDGLKLLDRVRSWSTMSIIVLSPNETEDHKIAMLDAGADDYITKPFSTAELLARVRAMLRRRLQSQQKRSILALGPLQIDLTHRCIRGPRGDVHLSPLERRVLECLARQVGTVVHQRQLLSEAWGRDCEDDLPSLRVCIKHLRGKVEPDPSAPRYLITVTGLGYCLRTDNIAPGAQDERRIETAK